MKFKTATRHFFSLKDLEEAALRAESCECAEIPGPQLRELLRLAKIGLKKEQSEDQD